MPKHLILIFALLTSYFIIHASDSMAQTSTDSADISDEEIKESIKERLEKVSQDDESSFVKRAWVGTIEDITNSTLTLLTDSTTRQAQVAGDASVVDEDRSQIDTDELEIGSFVIAMGFINGNEVLDAQRVVVAQEPESTSAQSTFVTITDIDDDIITVTDDQDQSFQLATTDDTTITQTVDDEQTEIELSDLQIGDQLVIIAEVDSKAPTSLDTTAIHLVSNRDILADPDGTNTEADQNATASAESE